MFCTNCGEKLKKTDKVCPKCSNKNTYKLNLNRPKSYVGCLVSFKIYVDGELKAKLKNGESTTIDISEGIHVISINKKSENKIDVKGDTTCNVELIGTNRFAITNVNGSKIEGDDISSIDNVMFTSKVVFYITIGLVLLSLFLIFNNGLYLKAWIFGITIGLAIVNISGAGKHKEMFKDKFNTLMIYNKLAILISIVGCIISIICEINK